MATDQERTDARNLLSGHISQAVLQAMRASPDPQLVYRSVAMTLVGLAGSHVLTMARAGVLRDGETDKVLNLLCESLRQHADPRAQPGEQQDIFRADFKGTGT